MPLRGQDFGISPRSAMRLGATIATGARMRVQGDVHFKLSYDEAEDVPVRAISLLGTRLMGVSEAEDTVAIRTVDVGKVDVETDSADAAGGDEGLGPGGTQKVWRVQLMGNVI